MADWDPRALYSEMQKRGLRNDTALAESRARCRWCGHHNAEISPFTPGTGRRRG